MKHSSSKQYKPYNGIKEGTDTFSAVNPPAGENLHPMYFEVTKNEVDKAVRAAEKAFPFPATTNFRTTSVGTPANKRFTRPLRYQNFPKNSLPEELQNENPLNIWRLINGKCTKEKL